jgi:oligoendopeptidase F
MMISKYEQTRWRLDDLYPGPDSPEFQQALENIEEKLQRFENLRPRFTTELPGDEFLNVIKRYEDLIRLLSRVINYGFLLLSEDMRSGRAQECWGRVQQIAAQAERRTLFLNLWWNALDEKQAEELLEAAADYRYWLGTMRLQKPFSLSEIEEKIITIKDAAGTKGFLKLYETITGRLVFKLKIAGETREFTRHELNDYVRDPNPNVRAEAYQEYLRVFEQDAPFLGQIYQSRVRDWRSENVQLRGYASPIAVRNLINDLTDDTVEVLLEACRDNISLFHRYFRLKARTIGMGRLRRYDIYAPVSTKEKWYQFEEAVHLVLESFHRFDPPFADYARSVLEDHHLDSEVREGKRPGAFCVSVEPGLTPWVSTSFEGNLEDVATLARELGRAVHYSLAAHHTAFTQKPSRMLSEVASAFCEMLTIDHLIAVDDDQETRRDLLYKRMDNAYAAIMRQANFVMFEQKAHDRIHAGASVDDLNEMYLACLKDQFSASIDLSDDFRYEWLGISTLYHLPFYAYAYAFGRLLVLSLYHQYRMEDDPFKSRFLTILEAGGSDSPARILNQAGIDITSYEAWQAGFDALAAHLEEIEVLEGMRRQE